MSTSFPRRLLWLAALVLTPALLQAQARVTGHVRGADGSAIADARVVLQATRFATTTQRDGRYVLNGVPAGRYDLEVRAIGYQPLVTEGIVVGAGGEVVTDVTLTEAAVQLTSLVVSASRRIEKVTEAPATVSRIDATELENSVGNSFAGALKLVKGIDYVQVGVTNAAINARGFNSSFNNRMLQMEDGRIATLGESGLPLGALTSLSKLDLAGVEVVVGPGSALYGANASNGVVTLQTKDPKAYPGLAIEVAGGSRGYQDYQGRYAGVSASGDWGWKVTGEYQKALDFTNILYYGTAPNTRPDTMADFNTSVGRGTAALVRYLGNSRLELAGGYSITNGIGLTNNGRNQLVDYTHNFQQLKFTSPHWYATAYRTASGTGGTYQLNSYATNRPVLPPSVSDDSVRSLASFPGGSYILFGELQYNNVVPALLNTRITVGSQVRHDVATSERRWLEDRKTGEDVTINQVGGYLQTETPLLPRLNLVLAGRLDKESDYDAQFSPKAALVWSPIENQTFRVSVNKAYKNPTILAGYFYLTDFSIVVPGNLGIGVFGNRFGITFRDVAGNVVNTVPGLVPETNTTWEVGWKGILADRLYIDVTGYEGSYQNFFSPLGPYHAAPLSTNPSRTYGYDQDGNELLGATGNHQWVFGYRNLGEAKIRGADLGVRWLPSSRISVDGTMSVIHLRSVDTTGTGTAGREAASINSSPTKISLGVNFIEPVPNLLLGVTARSSDRYFFRSGVNVGEVPKYQTTDLFVGYKLPSLGAQLNLSINNLYTCSHGRYDLGPGMALPGTLDKGKECGFGQKHLEMVNVPEIGTVAIFGVRIER